MLLACILIAHLQTQYLHSLSMEHKPNLATIGKHVVTLISKHTHICQPYHAKVELKPPTKTHKHEKTHMSHKNTIPQSPQK